MEICDQYKGELDEFEKWAKSQPQLPKNMRRLLLLRFLKVCDFDQEKSKNLLLYNLEIRKSYPNIFTDRDIMSERLQVAMKTVQACALPKHTEGKCRVTVFRLRDEDHTKYDVVDNFKALFMMSDTRFVTPDPENVGLTEGEIGIMDFSGFSFRHFLKVATNLSSTRLYLRYVQEAVPFKIFQNHFINCSPILTRIMTLIRPFIKKELFDVMHFHTSGYESLYEHVPRDILPEEYGGYAGKLDDLFEEYIETLYAEKDYLKDDSNWQLSDE